LCSDAQRSEVLAYAEKAKNRSEIDRMADTKKTGVFTGAHCINPFTGKQIPVWVSDYVLAGYGTGAIMAVPAHDERDFEFATAFNLPVVPVIKPADAEIEMPLKEAFSAKDGICFNSGFLNGLTVKDAIKRAIDEVETLGIGKRKVNYKLREAGFGRQRYWGEPFPIVYDNDGIPHLIAELPVELPVVESYKPTGTGESPLAAVKEWVNVDLDDWVSNPNEGWGNMNMHSLTPDPLGNSRFYECEDSRSLTPDPSPRVERGDDKTEDAVFTSSPYENEGEENSELTTFPPSPEEKNAGGEEESKLTAFPPSPEGRGDGGEENSELTTFPPSPEGRGDGGEGENLVNEPFPGYNNRNLKLVRELRQNETEAEKLLWQNLRGQNLGVKFRRQHPIGSFICDFVSLSHKLVIELDGEVHKHQKEYDQKRTEELNKAGFDVIRFWNDEVLRDMSRVLEKIRAKLSSLTPDYTNDGGNGENETGEMHSLTPDPSDNNRLYEGEDNNSLTPDPSPQVERGEIPDDHVINPGTRETDTMPGWAGSSWYFLRYTDPNNSRSFAGKEALDYWQQVDLYVGGSEHATGHLLYSRFWTKFLFDLGYISWDEPFKKLVNQGMIGGEDGQKMSKRWGNVVNPDDVIAEYSADALRLYEMFLGPLTDSKPWNTNGIEGVSRFLGKFWRLFHEGEIFTVSNDVPTADELKVLHKTIKKVTWDIDNMSFNTSVSAFMVATNELGQLKCRKKAILEPLLVLLAPFAPHMTEELWHLLGNTGSIHAAQWPEFDEKHLTESSFSYPISINGKTRTSIEFSLDTDVSEIEKAVLADDTVQKWMEGKPLKKMIVVKGRIVNVVV
jgi:very-short-patch-repair endonuclease